MITCVSQLPITVHPRLTSVCASARMPRSVGASLRASTGSTRNPAIAGIAWVIQHRHDNGLNIRVLNLSFGTDGTQSYLLDPLAYAAEMAWRKGIFVVVSGHVRWPL